MDERLSEILAASCNIQTAAEQIANSAQGDKGLEEIAKELSRWAVAIEYYVAILRLENVID